MCILGQAEAAEAHLNSILRWQRQEMKIKSKWKLQKQKGTSFTYCQTAFQTRKLAKESRNHLEKITSVHSIYLVDMLPLQTLTRGIIQSKNNTIKELKH